MVRQLYKLHEKSQHCAPGLLCCGPALAQCCAHTRQKCHQTPAPTVSKTVVELSFHGVTSKLLVTSTIYLLPAATTTTTTHYDRATTTRAYGPRPPYRRAWGSCDPRDHCSRLVRPRLPVSQSLQDMLSNENTDHDCTSENPCLPLSMPVVFDAGIVKPYGSAVPIARNHSKKKMFHGIHPRYYQQKRGWATIR